MHILWLKTELLHPVDKGGRIRTYHMLRVLRRDHRITYLTLDDGEAGPDAVEHATEYCTNLIRVPFDVAQKRTPPFYAQLAANVFSSLPYAIAKYRSRQMERLVSEAVRGGTVDVVVCDFLAPAINVPSLLGAASVLFQHNVEALIWQRHTEVARNRLTRAYFREQWRRMRNFEREQCLRFDRVVAVSPQDLRLLEEDYGVVDGTAVATGVDVEHFRPTMPGHPRMPLELVFTGSMDWLPNEDAVRYFVGEVLPRIRTRLPDTKLTIVGRNPSPAVTALTRDPAIHVTGRVSDVRPFLERGSVFVVPLRIGGGTRLKMYEAMAMEIPVVSTSIGAEGLPVRDGEHLVIADDAESFAAAVVGLLQDPARQQALAQSAAEYVRRECSWERVATDFADICESVAGHRRSTLETRTP